MNIYVVYEVDHLEGLISAAMMSDNASELRRANQDLEKAANVLKSWAQASGGNAVLDLAAMGALEVPAEKMNELPALRRQFQAICDGTLSVGVGLALSEAHTALKSAKTRGGDQIALYVPEMEEELATFEDEAGTLESLGKAAPTDAKASMEKPEEPKSPQQDETAPQDAQDPGPNAGQSDEQSQDPKAAVMAALKDIKTNADAIESLKESNPAAFKSVMEVVQAMILMAQGMAEDTDLSKADKLLPPMDQAAIQRHAQLALGSKGFHEHLFPVTAKVRVHWADGMQHEDSIKGLNSGHAMARAASNWPDAVKIEHLGHG